jgi:hypothetical protein
MRPTHPGKLVAGRFEIGPVAGSGGMGIVYRAHDRETNTPVALKVLLERDQGPMDRFAHEVRLLSRLEHPNIIGYVTHGVTSDGVPFLVMPWLDGMDLERRLRSGFLSIEETLSLAHRVAGALAYLHGQGLVHRDLKPSNLFLPGGRVEDVLVIDLGVARPSRSVTALTVSGVLIGTPGFIAPEQARGEKEIQPSVDIFAIGCVLFECLTGRRLFNGAHLMSVLAKILLEDAPRVGELRADTPPLLDVLVHRMVSKDPSKRPRDGAALLRHLNDLDKPGMDPRPSASHKLTQSERRVMTVLVVVLPDSQPHGPAPPNASAESLFESASVRFGVRAYVIAARTLIAVALEKGSAADQTAVLARFALRVAETEPAANIALTTGSAVSGERLPVGEAIDRAVKMARGHAPPAGVQADEVTAALVAGRFDVRREASGLRVHEERRTLDPTRPLLGRPTSCVGRERELSILEAALADCADGEGPRVVLVTSAAGGGKSRLRHEFLRRIHGHPRAPLVLQCHGDPVQPSKPYGLIAQLVRQAAGLGERESAETMAYKLWAHVSSVVPEAHAVRVNDFLGEIVGAAFDDAGSIALHAARLDAAAMADQIARAFEDIMRAWARPDRLALMLEDCHWADVASIKVLEHALRKLAGTGLFVLALARPEVHEQFASLFETHHVTAIRLPPIPKRACARLVYEVMGEDTPHANVDRLVERSEGNGFYLEELIRAAAHGDQQPGTQTTMSSFVENLPETILAVAQARLGRLEPSMRRVLRAASIVGDVFGLDTVRALVGLDLADVEAMFAALAEQELVAPVDTPRIAGGVAGGVAFTFRHALLRATAYASLTEEDRTLGHRLAAGWLQHVNEDDEIVARHWLEGGERTRAADSFTSAAEVRWRRAQVDASARCAGRALFVSEPHDEADQTIAARVHVFARALEATRAFDVRKALGALDHHSGQVEARAPHDVCSAVAAILEPSLRAIRASAQVELRILTLVDAACALGAVADYATARALLEEANQCATAANRLFDATAQAAAKIAYWAGEWSSAVELLAETVLPHDRLARLQSLLILAVAVVTLDGEPGLHRGLEYVVRAEAILDASTDDDESVWRENPVARGRCAGARLLCFHLAGDHKRAAQAAELGVALAHSAGLRWDESAQLHNAAEQYLHLGDTQRTRTMALASNAIATDLGVIGVVHSNEVLLAYLDDDVDRLHQLAEEARPRGPWQELHSRYWLARHLASIGSSDARYALRQALHLAQTLRIRTMIDECTRALDELGRS